MPAPPAYPPLPLSRGVRDLRAMRAHLVRPRPGGLLGAYSQTVLADNPLSRWRLNETSGIPLGDSLGANNGSYSVAMGGGTGIASAGSLLRTDSDAAASFASSQYATVPNNAGIQLATGSLEFLINTSQANDAGFHGMVVKRNAWGVLQLDSGKLGLFDWTAGVNRDSGVAVNDGLRHHIVLTFQSGVTNGTVLYLDGLPVLTTTITVLDQTNLLGFATGTEGASQFTTGTVDEVALYDHVLPAARVLAHYQVASGVTGTDVQVGTVVFGGQVPVEIGGITVSTPTAGRQMPLRRGVRDRPAMLRYARFGSFAAPLFQDTPTGTLILGGQVPVEIGGITVSIPAHGRLMPLSRGVRDQRAMFRYARSGSFTAPVFQDALTGTLILGGLVPVEISGLTLPTPAHGRPMPLKRGIRDKPAMLRYRSSSLNVAAAVLFQDASTGALIFAGTAILGIIEADAQTGILILAGSATSDTIIPNPLTPVRSRSRLAWVDYGAIREPF